MDGNQANKCNKVTEIIQRYLARTRVLGRKAHVGYFDWDRCGRGLRDMGQTPTHAAAEIVEMVGELNVRRRDHCGATAGLRAASHR